MAGLGEVCTHVGAVLFYLETQTRVSGVSQCTQEKCSWVVPSFQKEIPYTPISDIDFTSAKGKMKAIHQALHSSRHGIGSRQSTSHGTTSQVHHPSPSKPRSTMNMTGFYSELSQCGYKPAILSIVKEHAHLFQLESKTTAYPKPLQSLYDPNFLQLGYSDLLSACDKIATELHITEDMVAAVENTTIEQSKSKVWFKYRAGRITASKMKSVCRTNPVKPSQSLIKTICYPEAYGFTTLATTWGCKHEKTALDFYAKASRRDHDNHTISKECGLFLSCEWPFIGASPDGIVNCACCGKGVVEIKCSYCHRFDHIDQVATDKRSCLEEADGTVQLSTSHAYYYQVQTQIHVCKVDYGDFCLCTFPDGEDSPATLHIERIMPDDVFWHSCVESSQHFFKKCLLPELLGRWYSRPRPTEINTSHSSSMTTLTTTPLATATGATRLVRLTPGRHILSQVRAPIPRPSNPQYMAEH